VPYRTERANAEVDDERISGNLFIIARGFGRISRCLWNHPRRERRLAACQVFLKDVK
jgi:hypothetical protein